MHLVHDELPLHVYESLLDEVADGFEKKPYIVLTGGEPMLRCDFFEIASMISDKGFKWGMTSNATLIDERNATKLVECGLKTISVSLDGTREIHDAIRGVSGAFDKAVRGIEELSKTQAIADIMATTVVNHETVGRLDEMFELMAALPIDQWRVIGVEPIGSALKRPDMLMTTENQRTLLDFIKSKRADGWPVSYGCSHFLGSDYEGYVRDWHWLCNAGIHVMSVTSTGNIVSCLDIERRLETIFGNIADDSLVDVWRDGFGIYRDGLWKRNRTCLGCDSARFCRGDAAHSWDFDDESPRFCAKKLYPFG